MTNLEIDIGRLHLANPVTVASGTFGYGIEFKPFLDISLLGAIIAKGLTVKPKQGNSPPRIVETPSGILNAIGMENVGIEAFTREKLPQLRELGAKVIANISGESIDDFLKLTDILCESNGIIALEVNVSCPNIKKGGMQFGTDLNSIREVTSAIAKRSSLPVIIKLSPNVTNIVEFALACEDSGADALSLINTLLGMSIDTRTQLPVLGNIFGGLSGPAIKPVALRMVWQVTDAVRIPVIGMGGIMNAQDAIEFLLAGASAISVGTANFINPSIALDIIYGIQDYLEENKLNDVSEIIGLAKIKNDLQ